jgi:hypothetical protein
MRRKSLVAVLSACAGVVLMVALSQMVACPLSHDPYETDRPCWDEADCVGQELCHKPDGGTLAQGTCDVPTDGPCLILDGGVEGYHCFADDEGHPQVCYHDLQHRCVDCALELDGGLPDGGCPDASCLQWEDRWGCR